MAGFHLLFAKPSLKSGSGHLQNSSLVYLINLYSFQTLITKKTRKDCYSGLVPQLLNFSLSFLLVHKYLNLISY